ncbi:maleylpyruvate isomerase family mycothiol-dependent enzyme [Streptomyces sp. NBC_00102]|uniref:maleylpyruvate isomerase family mycothiol-dependent enzyme n=1 Tax=Streptomyces sp. NBC_00102 TaxID=2975652 RepID=UPI00224CC53D|nr:maleylpyruvate isomerase family mycothiol-dependent enzyme [Streptomyces sp. NBC_00102]MCX5401651.1 maleylpyruvate isomerase family mycothiol-dependent enzyme [Streptomyces sp. NBC_00102]
MHTRDPQDESGPLPEALRQAIRGTADDIAALLRSAPGTAGAVPGSQWTVGEAAAHLAMANELMADLAAGHERPYGDGTPQSLAPANARALAAFGERRAEPLAAMITEQAGVFLAAVDRADTEAGDAESTGAPTPITPLGPMNRAVLASYLLTHMLGHGYDLARAVRRPHMIDGDRVGLCMPFMLSVMPRVADPAATARLTARFAVRLRGGGTVFGVDLAGGAVAVTEGEPERPDCTLLIDPVAFLLIALGRRNPWVAIARGQVFAQGRKPWLGPRFPALFTAP